MLKKLEQLLILSTLGLSAAHAAPTNGTFIQGSGDITVNGQETVLNVTGLSSNNPPLAQVSLNTLNIEATEQLTITCPAQNEYSVLPVVQLTTNSTTQAQVAGKIYSNSCVVLLASPGGWKTTATAVFDTPGMMLAAANTVTINQNPNTSKDMNAVYLNNKPIQVDPATKFNYSILDFASNGLQFNLYVNGLNTMPITMLMGASINVIGDSADDKLVSSGVWGGGWFYTNTPIEISGKLVAPVNKNHPNWGVNQDLFFRSLRDGYYYDQVPLVASKLFSIGHLELDGEVDHRIVDTVDIDSRYIVESGDISFSQVNKNYYSDRLSVIFRCFMDKPAPSLMNNVTTNGVDLQLVNTESFGVINASNQAAIILSSSNVFGTINAVNSGVSASGGKLAAGGSITVSGADSYGNLADIAFTNFINEGTINVPSVSFTYDNTRYDASSDSWLKYNGSLSLAGTVTNYGTMNVGPISTPGLTLENFGIITSLMDASLWADTLLNQGGIKAYGTVSASNLSGSGTITQAKMTAPQMFNKVENASALTVNNYANGWINLQKTEIAQKSATPLVAKPAPVVAMKPAPVATAPVAVAKKPVAALAQPAPVVVQKSAKAMVAR